MQMVILAGGMATRLGPVTQEIPKSMICFNGKPFLEYQIELLRSSGITDLVLCVGHLCEQIQEYFGDGSRFGVNIKYSIEKDKLLGTGGALKMAEPLLEEEFLLMYGDSFLLLDYQEIMNRFRNSDKQGLMVAYKNDDCYDCSNVVVEDNLVKIYDKKQKTPDMVYIDEGLLALKKPALSLIPEKEVVPLENLLCHLVEQKQLLAFETNQRFYEIGSHAGIEGFEELVREGGVSL